MLRLFALLSTYSLGLTRFFRRSPSDVLQQVFTFDRVVVTPYTFTTIFLPAIFSYYVMAVLVQLPHTRLYRAALLLVVFWMTIRANVSLDFSWNYLGYAYFNQGLSVSVHISQEFPRLKFCNPARDVYRRNA